MIAEPERGLARPQSWMISFAALEVPPVRERSAVLGVAVGLVILALVHPALPALTAPVTGLDLSVPTEVSAVVEGLVSELPGPEGPVSWTWGPVMRVHYVNGQRLQQADPRGLLTVIDPAEAWLVVGYRNGEPDKRLIIGREQGQMQVVEEGPEASLFDATLRSYHRLAPDLGLGSEPLLIKFEGFYFLAGSGPRRIYAIPVFDRPDFTGDMDNATLWPGDQVLQFMQAQQWEAGVWRRP